MNQHLGAVSVLVRDYDEAIAYYTGTLGFRLVEDTPLSRDRRWVQVTPQGGNGCALLLAKADGPRQVAAIGAQTGGRVFLFLHTDDFWRDYRLLAARGVRFCEAPREEAYGTVAVFEDLYGNRWDLLQVAIRRPDLAASGALNRDAGVNPTIREATATDAEWKLDHIRRLIADPGSNTPLLPQEIATTVAQQAELFASARSRGDLFLVAEVGTERVGELNLRRGVRPAFRHTLLLGISIDQAWRHRGIGTALMAHALAWAEADRSVRRIELFVYATNAPAIRLYQRHGFVLEGVRRNAVFDGTAFIDDWIMARYVGGAAEAAERSSRS